MMIEIRLPELSDNIHHADILKVLVAPGDTVRKEQPLLELETEKAVFEFPSPEGGVIREVRVSAGARAAVGEVLFLLEISAEDALAPGVTPDEPPPASPASPAPGPTSPASLFRPEEEAPVQAPAAPSVRRLARELGVDLAGVHGTGPRGRIGAEDVRRAAGMSPSPAFFSGIGAPALPDFSKWGPVRREPMSQVRKITAETLSRAWMTIPHVTSFDDADATAVEAFRKKYGDKVRAAGGRLTVTAVLLKVCALALRRFPRLNASVDMAGNEIVFKDHVHIGVAVDTDRGLLVPVIRDADRKPIVELSADLARLSGEARTKKLQPGDMEGGTFTISNLGGIGGTGFTPIVYPPQVAILGVSRTRVSPVWQGGQFHPRPMLPLSLSYDHRLVDGAEGTRFLRWVCDALEDPLALWLEG